MQVSAAPMDERPQMPDVTAYTLERALKALQSGGIYDDKITVRLTAPPRRRDEACSGNSRVVGQAMREDGTVELLVANMENI